MAKKDINLVLSSNGGPASLLKTIQQEQRNVIHAIVFVAFITEDGVRRILNGLKQVARRGGVNLITGLYQGFTSPEALRLLLQAQRQTGGNLSVRFLRHPGFHRIVETPTPDGKWFVAYKAMGNMDKEINDKMWKKLNQCGITKMNARRMNHVSDSQMDELLSVLRAQRGR